MNCKSVQLYLSAYLDGELSGQECLQVREHLCGCKDCREEEQQLRSLKHMLRGLPCYTPTQGFEDRLVSNVMRKSERRRVLAWNIDWRLAGGFAAAATIAAFALLQATERRVPAADTQPMVRRDDLDMMRDQLFMAGNDPLSGNRFAVPTIHGKE